jgi:hypothetical protein
MVSTVDYFTFRTEAKQVLTFIQEFITYNHQIQEESVYSLISAGFLNVLEQM